jgi:hypothetical protein
VSALQSRDESVGPPPEVQSAYRLWIVVVVLMVLHTAITVVGNVIVGSGSDSLLGVLPLVLAVVGLLGAARLKAGSGTGRIVAVGFGVLLALLMLLNLLLLLPGVPDAFNRLGGIGSVLIFVVLIEIAAVVLVALATTNMFRRSTADFLRGEP